MKKLIIIVLILAVGAGIRAQSPQLLVEYDFNNNLLDKKENSILQAFGELNDGYSHNNATSGYGSDDNGSYWYWTSTLSRGGGFWIDLDSDVNISTSYTIGVRFSYTLVSGTWRKIIDYSNLSQDYGFYFYNNGFLRFYSYTPQGINQASANVVVDVIATRAANNTFTAYFVVNGNLVQEFTVSDASNWAVPTLVNGKRRLNFFHDDNVTSGEATNGGKVYSVKIWDGPISASDIEDAMNVYWEGSVDTQWDNPANWSSNEVPTSTNDVEILNVTNKPVIELGVNAAAKNITVISNSEITIDEGGSLSVIESLTNNGQIIVSSGPTGEGSIISQSTAGSGTYRVERYLSANQWHLVTSPITAGTAGVFENIWLRPYEESTNSFGDYIQPPATPMPTGQGFSVWAPTAQTRTFTGTINNTSVTKTLQRSPDGGDLLNFGWNLIGNPYPCAIDLDAASGWTKNNVGRAVYVWDGGLSGGQYRVYLAATGTEQGIAANGGSRYVAMGQGFFVQAITDGATLTMDKPIRVHNSIEFRDDAIIPDMININVAGNGCSDESVIYYKAEADENFDFDYDAAKLYGTSAAPQLYTKKQDNMLTINSINDFDELNGKFVYLEVGVAGEYMLEFSHSMISYLPVIKDLFTEQYIYPGQNYVFFANPDDNPERFQFSYDLTGITEEAKNDISVWAFENVLRVESKNGEEIGIISVYTIHGHLVMQFTELEKDLSSLAPAVYVVKVNYGNRFKIERIVIK